MEHSVLCNLMILDSFKKEINKAKEWEGKG